MRKDQEFIFKLRHEGRSFREIQVATGVSRGTLSRWFHGQDWSNEIAIRRSNNNPALAKERMERMNIVRKLKLQYEYAIAESEALKQYETYKQEPLFIEGIKLYKRHGDLVNRYRISLSTSNVSDHQTFRQFCQKYLDITGEKLHFGLLLYPEHIIERCKQVWSEKLDMDIEDFYKCQVVKGKINEKRLQFGVGITIISSTASKKKLLRWLECSEK